MTWTKLGDQHFASPTQLGLSRNARLLHIEALVYCNGSLTDGFIPSAAMRLVTDDPDVNDDVQSLIAADLWAEAVGGFQIVGFGEKGDAQLSKADVEKIRDGYAERQRRQRQHRNGDHSGCSPQYCRSAVTRDANSDANSDSVVTHGTPLRPATTRNDRKGVRVSSGRSAPTLAEARSGAPRPLKVGDAITPPGLPAQLVPSPAFRLILDPSCEMSDDDEQT